MSWLREQTAAECPAGRDGHHDLRRDVRAGHHDRVGEPRAGLPGHRRPARDRRGGRPRDHGGPGISELRQAIAAHQKRFYGIDLDPDTQVLVTAGATEAIAATLIALLEPGDEAIAFEPYYDSYAACIAMAGARRVPVTLRPPDFRPDLDALGAAITSRTRLILLNTPHNPTGVVFTPGELTRIAELACEHDLLVISDEVYEHMVFDGTHVPIASL